VVQEVPIANTMAAFILALSGVAVAGENPAKVLQSYGDPNRDACIRPALPEEVNLPLSLNFELNRFMGDLTDPLATTACRNPAMYWKFG